MKAVLVIDVPSDYGDIVDNKAIVTLRNGKLGTSLGIYNVPLRPMPSRTEGIGKEPFELEDALQEGYASGWNDCIDELVGETE